MGKSRRFKNTLKRKGLMKQVWQSKDGTVHNCKEEAQFVDNQVELREKLNDIFKGINSSTGIITFLINRPKEIRDILTDFIRRNNNKLKINELEEVP